MLRSDSTRQWNNGWWTRVAGIRVLKRRLLPIMPRTGSISLKGRPPLFVDLHDFRGPSFYVLFGGPKAFEHYELAEKTLILEHLPAGGTFIDIGANIGLFSFFVHHERPDAQVYSIEPHPVLHHCLEQTRRTWGSTALKPLHLGLSDRETSLELYLDQTDSGGHSLHPESLARQRGTSSIQVPVCTLDQLVEKEGIQRVDVVKIDTQAHEIQVLKGAQNVIDRFQPHFLIEFDHASLTSEAISSLTFPIKHRYRWKPARSNEPLRPLDELSGHALSALEAGQLQANYLFVSSS